MEIKEPMDRTRLEWLLDWFRIPYTFKAEILAEFDMLRATIYELTAANKRLQSENDRISETLKKLLNKE